MIRLAANPHSRPCLPGPTALWCLVCVLILAHMTGASAAVDNKGEAGVAPARWVELLADDSYEIREKATRELWMLGDRALPYLDAASREADPERVKRARMLIRKIGLGISPDTPEEILALVNDYERAKGQDKVRVFYKLREHNAWKQVLKLYALESDPAVLETLREAVEGVAVLAARGEIAAGRLDAARFFLEMAPADAQGMIGLAAFRQAFGIPDSQSVGRFERSRKLWNLSRSRVAGRYAEAARDADDVGDPVLAAGLRLLEGDPLPWLQQASPQAGNLPLRRIYVQLASRRWAGDAIDARDLLPVRRELSNKGQGVSRELAIQTMALLGCDSEVDSALMDSAEKLKWDAFRHFEILERIPEALKSVGLDPDNPDFAAWLEQHVKVAFARAGDGEDRDNDLPDMISFLERRGLQQVLRDHFDPAFKELAEKEPEVFLRYVASLCGGWNQSVRVPGPVLRCASAFAREDDAKWEELLASATKDSETAKSWWAWLGDLQPDMPRARRLEALMCLLHICPDPGDIRSRLLEKAWKAFDSAKQEDKPTLAKRLADLALESKDAATGLRALQFLWKNEDDDYTSSYVMFLSATGNWKECASIWLALASKYPAQPDMHAHAAAALRRTGREAEAVEHDRMAARLALGDGQTELRIATAYAIGGDSARAISWWKKILAECRPSLSTSSPWSLALGYYAEATLREGKWKEAAAAAEALALQSLGSETGRLLPALYYRCRLNADLPRAMLMLPNDRSKATDILRSCQQILASDGSLADNFFPAIRAAGLHAEHDAWFEDSWSRLMKSIQLYPNCDNTRNTAAWLAARAVRRLDEAEAQETSALRANPANGAYMDTMAEIQFARGQRAKALEWSGRSLVLEPLDIQIRAQHERFRTAPLPQK